MSLEKLTGLPENSVWHIMNFLVNVGYIDRFYSFNANIHVGKITIIYDFASGIKIKEEKDDSNGRYISVEGIPQEVFDKIKEEMIKYCHEKAKKFSKS